MEKVFNQHVLTTDLEVMHDEETKRTEVTLYADR